MVNKNEVSVLIWQWLDDTGESISRTAHYDLQERIIKYIETLERKGKLDKDVTGAV